MLPGNLYKPSEGFVPIALQLFETELDPFCQDRIEHPEYSGKC
ncbi:hypothetical protein DESAMIL20_1471 [Desulfurella amilsii]|uniref:Uncharacterized protein n=1 Tax=Desulfurella amilsii TaxID=1562698 RepID=A0A1X4XWM4_9BACT|nr:hypothetical protein DESAMIL20_1471 [Desulfurella amilsii]